MIAQHLGPLHPVEQALTLALAFGPFVVLGIVIFFKRRAEARDAAQADDRHAPTSPADHGGTGPGQTP